MSKSQPPVLVTAGEFFLDLIFYDLPQLPALGEELKSDNFEFSFGGGAAITAVAARRIGVDTKLITAWGDTVLDSQARQGLQRQGVDSSLSAEFPRITSGLTVAVSTREDRYFLTCPGANRFVEDMILSTAQRGHLRSASHVHLALTPSQWEPFTELVLDLSQHGVTTSWDLGWDPDAARDPEFRRLWSHLSVLFLNEMEALRYTGADNALEAAQKATLGSEVPDKRPNVVVVKMGARGALACSGVESATAAPPEVDAVDSTGAGDAFNGGFLAYWIRGFPLQDCLRAGNILGALSTRGPGGTGTLPDQTEFEIVWAGMQEPGTGES